MGIVLSSAFALTQIAAGNADYPAAGWHSLVTVGAIAADHELAAHPATNLANPATNEVWKSGSIDEQHLTVLFGDAVTVDYVAVARHNFGTGQVQVTVEGLPVGGDPQMDADWVELVEANFLATDRPALWRYIPTELIGVRLKLDPGAIAPQAAVLYCGKLLVFERGVQPGHTPIPYGRQRNVVSPRSQSGEYLGRVVTGGGLSSSVNIIKLSPAWYRSTLDPFFEVAAETPFFWAWSPERYPDEVGYVWLTNQPVPNPSDLTGYIDITMQMEGLIL